MEISNKPKLGIIIVGDAGAGKTTVAAIIEDALGEEGFKVNQLDTECMGVSSELLERRIEALEGTPVDVRSIQTQMSDDIMKRFNSEVRDIVSL